LTKIFEKKFFFSPPPQKKFFKFSVKLANRIKILAGQGFAFDKAFCQTLSNRSYFLFSKFLTNLTSKSLSIKDFQDFQSFLTVTF